MVRCGDDFDTRIKSFVCERMGLLVCLLLHFVLVRGGSIQQEVAIYE